MGLGPTKGSGHRGHVPVRWCGTFGAEFGGYWQCGDDLVMVTTSNHVVELTPETTCIWMFEVVCSLNIDFACVFRGDCRQCTTSCEVVDVIRTPDTEGCIFLLHI